VTAKSRRALDHSDPAVRSEFVLACVAEAARLFLVDARDVMSKCRTKSVAAARGYAMALVRRRTTLSYPEIGRLFGRDHSSVMHMVKKTEAEMPERLAWAPPIPEPSTPTSELTLEQWEDRMGWSREVAAE
jgi:chromosomal replication initiation ATPase DnaA